LGPPRTPEEGDVKYMKLPLLPSIREVRIPVREVSTSPIA
jgi:hypothetical protein